MSNVVSPRGPLPPRVYWRRRLLLVAVVVGVVLLIGQFFGGGDDDTAPVADRATPTPTAQPTKAAAADKSRTRGRKADRPKARRDRAAPTTTLTGASGPLAQPTGPCKASEVAVVPDVEDADAFGSVPLRIGLSATGDRACTFAFGPDSVQLRVTSGDDLIWESLHCGSAVPERSVVVRPGWLSYLQVDWNGRRGSEEGCGATSEYAQPGYYWAEAAAVGGEPARSQFELETPPKPKPSPSPEESEEPEEPASEQPTAREDGSADEGGAGSQESEQRRDSWPQGSAGRDGEADGQAEDEEPIDPRKVGG